MGEWTVPQKATERELRIASHLLEHVFLSGSAADCIARIRGVSSGTLLQAVDHLITGDHLISPPLGSAALVRSLAPGAPGRGGRPAARTRPGSQHVLFPQLVFPPS